MNNPDLRVNLKDMQDYKCDDCGEGKFKDVYLIKKISALVSPSGKEMLYPIQVYACLSCNHINEYFLNAVSGDEVAEENTKSNIII